MSRIEELIEELCPDGVEYRRLGDVTAIKRGERIIKKRLQEDGQYVVISGGINPMGRTNKHNRNANTITISSYGTAGYVNFVTEDFWANDVCLCVYPCGDDIDNKFLYYALRSKQDYFYRNTTKAIPDHIPTDVIKDTEIPVPPLQVQEEIVRILDAFTKLTAELTTELAMRTKQYAYYRDELLTGELMPDNVQYMSIGELIQFSSLRQKHISSQAPVYSVSNKLGLPPLSEYRMEGTSAHASKDTSEYYVVRKDWFAYSPARLNVGSIVLMYDDVGLVSPSYKVFTVKDENVILHDYLMLLLKTSQIHAAILRYIEIGVRAKLDSDRWNRIYVPVPDIESQKRAVAFLHDLESVCTDLTTGLPAEIAAREKQYAYYRDRILDFPHMQS